MKNLTMTSPLQKVQNIIVPTVEKIIVDLFVDANCLLLIKEQSVRVFTRRFSILVMSTYQQ